MALFSASILFSELPQNFVQKVIDKTRSTNTPVWVDKGKRFNTMQSSRKTTQKSQFSWVQITDSVIKHNLLKSEELLSND